ncbi:unnamed protein product [Rhizophagus irregularis]|nr:unnamed protein product [Rhizophagus irregularis]
MASNVEESSNLLTIHLFHPWMIVYFTLVNIILFLESQYIAKPTQHLKFYKSSGVVKQKPKEYRLRRLSTPSKQFQPITEFDSDIPPEVYAAMELAQNDRGIAIKLMPETLAPRTNTIFTECTVPLNLENEHG